MNIEDRIREHLEASTSSLRAPDRLEEVMAEGRRRRVGTRVASVLAAAAVVALVVGLGSALAGDRAPGPMATDATTPTTTLTSPTTGTPPTTTGTPPTTTGTPPTTTGTPPTTTGTLEPVARGDRVTTLIASGPDGVTLVDATGQTTGQVASDPHYQAVDVAVPDLRGGLVFQHRITPLPWPQGSILRLPAGDAGPVVLASPEAGERLIPVGPAVSAEGHAVHVYVRERFGEGTDGSTSVTALDLDTGTTTEIAQVGPYVQAAAGGDLVSIVDAESADCVTLRLLRLDGSSVEPSLDCLPMGADVAVSGDGARLGVLAQSSLTIYDLDTGEVVSSHDVADAFALAGGSAGWSVLTGSTTQIVHDDGATQIDTVGEGRMVPADSSLELAADATLGSGTGELPCAPIESDLPVQDLPGPVAETREAIHAAASSCDYDALATLARQHGTVVSIGGGGEVDPITHWVAEARLGHDPLPTMARILATTPAENPDVPGTWGWPALAVDPSAEGSWDELTPILGEEMVTTMREAGSYLGLRVGILEDGTWQFATAGD